MSPPGASATDPAQLDPTPTGPARWAARAHGRLLSAFLVTLNILLILLFYFYFWRIFWKKPSSLDPSQPNPAAAAAGSDSSRSSASSSPRTSSKPDPEVVAALPVFVHSSTTSPDAAECAVCLAEFRDGDRGRVLPRCGHRFHLECVDVWAQLHSTCPLCRASLEPDSDHPDPDSAV